MSADSKNADAGNLSADALAARDARIELDYCAGIKPLRQIGKENGLSHTAVGKMAKERGWVRDLKARTQAKADDKVARAAVSTEVSRQKAATESQIVEVNAELQKQIRLEHRTDIKRGRGLFGALLDELEAAGVNAERLQDLYDTLTDPAQGAKLTKGELDAINKGRELLAKTLSLPSRIDSAKRLTEMLEKLVKMERQAFGISEEEGGEGGSGPGSPARTARLMTDVERAVRLAHLLAAQTKAPAPLAPAAPVTVDRT